MTGLDCIKLALTDVLSQNGQITSAQLHRFSDAAEMVLAQF